MSSELKANKISPATGTSFTLGDSGDTFTLPASATLSIAGTIDASSGTATGFGETNSPSWFAKITSKQTLSGSTWTVLNNATEQIDPDSAYDNATYAFTVPSGKAGYYFVTGGTMFPNGNDGYHYRLRFTVNGTSTGHQAWGRHESSTGGSQDVSLSLILSLSVADVVKMEGYTETAGDIGDGGDDAERCFFGGFLIAGA
jgi:hypothetical protein